MSKQTELFKLPTPDIKLAAVSLLQPWGSAVVMRLKLWETRSWSTNYRGPLFIHASKRVKPENRKLFSDQIMFGVRDNRELPAGAIIGLAYLTDVQRTEKIREELLEKRDHLEIILGDYSDNRYAWRLEHAIKFKNPVPFNGALSIWDPLKKYKEITDILQLSIEIESGFRQGDANPYLETLSKTKLFYEHIRKGVIKF